MKLNTQRIIKTVVLLIMFIITMYLIYNTMIINGKLSIEYRHAKDFSIKVYYDNRSKDYPFDEEHFIIGNLEGSGDMVKNKTIPLSLVNINKVRLDFDGVDDRVEIYGIHITSMGIKLKTFSPGDIISKFDVLYDIKWNNESNILTIRPTGNDPYFGSTNIEFGFKTIIIAALLVAALITLIISKIWSVVNFRVDLTNLNARILVAVFLCIIILPSITYGISKEELKKTAENRQLKKKPNIRINNILNYSKEYEEYYNDNLPFKSLIVKMNSIIKKDIFNVSPAKYVINGYDGWLFYNSKYKSDVEDTMADFQGTNKYNVEQLESRKKILVDRQKFLESQGIKMYMLIIPNKSQVYSEYMPKEYKKSTDSSRVGDMVNYLKENTKIPVIYPMEAFNKYKNKYQLYYKLDTHWNAVGAYVGYTELMNVIDNKFQYKSLEELNITTETIDSGDLVDMINLRGRFHDTRFSINNVKNDNKSTLVNENGTSEVRYTSSNLNGKKLLCFRDSFSIDLIPYLSKEFQESVYLWGIPYSEEIIKREKPDIVIFESVERVANFN